MEYRLWDDSDMEAFVRAEYPDFHECCYSKYPWHIQLVDSARHLILHRYGGLYADMDYLACDTGALAARARGPAVVYEENETTRTRSWCRPSPHPSGRRRRDGQEKMSRYFDSTGPRMLDRALARCRASRGVDACPASLPVARFNPSVPANRCEHDSAPLAVHHLTTVWARE